MRSIMDTARNGRSRVWPVALAAALGAAAHAGTPAPIGARAQAAAQMTAERPDAERVGRGSVNAGEDHARRRARREQSPGGTFKTQARNPLKQLAEATQPHGAQATTTATVATREEEERRAGEADVLPIALDPSPTKAFREALMRVEHASIVEHHRGGRTVVRRRDASNTSATSNVIGHLRSRPRYRKGAWKEVGIRSLSVSIEWGSE